jgi:hypothetical protein
MPRSMVSLIRDVSFYLPIIRCILRDFLYSLSQSSMLKMLLLCTNLSAMFFKIIGFENKIYVILNGDLDLLSFSLLYVQTLH